MIRLKLHTFGTKGIIYMLRSFRLGMEGIVTSLGGEL